LKKGVGRQMLRYGCPKQFWDDCIIRQAYVRSHTCLDIFGLEGQVPESNIKGETVDISTIAEYAWYEWVKLRDTAAKFPVSKIQLGRDLGTTIDIGPATTRRILKQNGLRYKLRIMGVALSGPIVVYGDTMSVVHNTQRHEYVFKKKSNSIHYHAVSESAAMGE
jgi:hypothetical protein